MKAAAQKLPYPAKQADMKLQPDSDLANYRAAGKLKDKVALITGADSGIGRAVAIAFAKEGAHVAIVFNENVADAEKTKELAEKEQRRCLVLQLDAHARTGQAGCARSEIARLGHKVAPKRPGQPEKLMTAYVLLASQNDSVMNSRLVHVTGASAVTTNSSRLK